MIEQYIEFIAFYSSKDHRPWICDFKTIPVEDKGILRSKIMIWRSSLGGSKKANCQEKLFFHLKRDTSNFWFSRLGNLDLLRDFDTTWQNRPGRVVSYPLCIWEGCHDRLVRDRSQMRDRKPRLKASALWSPCEGFFGRQCPSSALLLVKASGQGSRLVRSRHRSFTVAHFEQQNRSRGTSKYQLSWGYNNDDSLWQVRRGFFCWHHQIRYCRLRWRWYDRMIGWYWSCLLSRLSPQGAWWLFP